MKALIIINTIINFFVIIRWLRDQNYYYIEIERTFYKKTPYAITLNKIISGSRKEHHYRAIEILTIPLPGGKKALEND